MTFAAFLTSPPAQRAIAQNAPRHLNMAATESSSLLGASAATTSLVYTLASESSMSATPAKEFEPVLPDTGALLGIGAVVVFSAIATWVWANQVVPTSRTKLAISKRQGGVKQYLDELEEAGEGNGREFEQWLFTDWLEGRNTTAVAGRQKEPALPILKKANWNSGDNPILAATALILLGVTIASVTERVSLLFS